MDTSIALGLLGVLLIALELGFRAGRRASAQFDGPATGQVGAIQGAILGLLGLLLGFSFAAAEGRFLERHDLVVQEANAIGTSYLRADLLEEPHRSALRAALAEYTRYRIEQAPQLRSGLSAAGLDRVAESHSRIWNAARAGVAGNPALALVVLPPINDVIDLHSIRMAAGRKHLPLLVVGLLVACSALAIGTIGYGCGLGKQRRLALTAALALLIGAALWITIDLDHPRKGLLQISDAPLQELKFDAPAE